MLPAHTAILLTVALLAPSAALAQRARPAPLAPADIDAIVQLVKLEDTRSFDETGLTRLVNAAHPEVRRRAIVAVGRIADPRGRELLAALHGETNAELLATVAFATGQLKDAAAIAWLSGLLSNAKTPPAAAFEAARALGKMRAPEDLALRFGRGGDGPVHIPQGRRRPEADRGGGAGEADGVAHHGASVPR